MIPEGPFQRLGHEEESSQWAWRVSGFWPCSLCYLQLVSHLRKILIYVDLQGLQDSQGPQGLQDQWVHQDPWVYLDYPGYLGVLRSAHQHPPSL